MSCPERDSLVQRRLDGLPSLQPRALEQHLALCRDCRDLHLAAERLESALALFDCPSPPPHLTPRIVGAVLAERRRRTWKRGRQFAFAAAACLLLAPLTLGWLRRDSAPATGGRRPVVVAKAAVPSPESLSNRARAAGSAVAALTDRLGSQTLAQARILWEEAPHKLGGTLVEWAPLDAPLEPAADSLREAGRGVSTGLEPVTRSAQRALAYFTRELPMLGPGRRMVE